MRKFTLILIGIFVITAIDSHTANAFSGKKHKSDFELIQLLKPAEFVQMSFEQYISLTGKKKNLWNRLGFGAVKSKVKHDLKKNPQLQLSDYVNQKSRRVRVMQVLGWIIGAVLVLLLIFALIYSGKGGR